MKWQNWLAQLEELPPDAPEWDSYAEFLIALEQLGAAKLHERAEAHSALEQALQSIREKYGSSLANFGQGSLLSFSPASCPSRRALRVVRHLNELGALLGSFDETLHQTPSSPDDYREWRRLRNQQEDEIMDACDGLTRLLSATEEAEVENEVETVGEAVNETVSEEPETALPAETPAAESSPHPFVDTPERPEPASEITEVMQVTITEETVVLNGHSPLATVSDSHSPSQYSQHRTLEIIEETSDHHLNVLDFDIDGADDSEEAETTEEEPLSAAEMGDAEAQSKTRTETAKVVRKLRIFVSSPGDVGQERLVAQRVIERLHREFSAFLELEPILWEHEPLRATSHFQDQILAPSTSDIVICILWSRLGTRLPAQYKRADGSSYESGTEWEFEDALAAYKERGTPDLIVYRKSAEPHVSMSDEEALLQKLAQKRALDTFIDRWFGNPQESFKAAFHQFPSPDEFENLLENHLRRLIRERLPHHVTEAGEAAVSVRWHKGSPFRGLESFDYEHAPVFFGRTRAIGEIKNMLVAQAAQNRAFLMIFGMSGSGKSSLARAGVLPTITHPGIIEGIGVWRHGIMRPTDAHELLYGLALALLDKNGLPELHENGLNAEELASLLRDAPQRALAPLKAALQSAAESTAQREKLTQIPITKFALVIDQFEEIFTLENVDNEERDQFVGALSVLARSGLVWVICTMRSDFFARCAEIPTLMNLKEGDGQYHLFPPTFAEVSQMLVQPARAAGLRFEIDPATGNRLSDELQEAAGKDPGALPLLQFTLDELYKRRTAEGVLTFAAYKELGGLEGALAQRAEEVFTSLPLEVQAELPALLRALVTLTEEREAKVGARRVPLSNVATTPTRRRLVEEFIAARLLVSDQAATDEGVESVVRVAHEALLRHWPRVQQWLSEDMEFLRLRTRLLQQAARWTEEDRRNEYLLREGRPLLEGQDLLQRRRDDLEADTIQFIEVSTRQVQNLKRRRVGLISGVVSLFFLVVAGFGAFSYTQWQKSEKQKQLALDAVDKWTYDVPAKLASIPATHGALAQILDDNVKMLDDILSVDPDTFDAKNMKATNLVKSGDAWLLLNDTTRAKAAIEAGNGILENLYAIPQNRRYKDLAFDLATSYERVGIIRQQENKLQQAKQAFEKSLSLRNGLRETRPAVEREIAVSYEHLGEVYHQLKDGKASLQNYEKSWDIRARRAANKSDAEAQRDLLVSAVRMGDAYLDNGQKDKARQTYGFALKTAQTIAKTGAPEAKSDLSIVYDRQADLLLDEGKSAAALDSMQESLKIALNVADTMKTAESLHNLFLSYDRIGSVYQLQGQLVKALEYYAKSLPIAERLANDESSLGAQRDLIDGYVKIGDAHWALNNLQAARRFYWRGVERYDLVQDRWPSDGELNAKAAVALGQLTYIDLLFRNPQAALREGTRALILAPDQAWIAVNLSHAYLFNGKLDKALDVCRRHAKDKIDNKPFAQVVLDQYQEFKKRGLNPAGMNVMLAELQKLNF